MVGISAGWGFLTFTGTSLLKQRKKWIMMAALGISNVFGELRGKRKHSKRYTHPASFFAQFVTNA